jgi:hypothetical protein
MLRVESMTTKRAGYWAARRRYSARQRAKEFFLLALELVQRTGGVEALARHFQGHVEQQGQVRLQVRVHPGFQRFHLVRSMPRPPLW